MWDAITQFIPNILGFVMRFIYDFTGIYWLTLMLFTIFIKVILFPLSVKQQKSSAKMAAFQPLISEITKTYANNKERQQEEMMKLQQEHGYSPLSGCLPLLFQMPILFGLIDVVYRPVTHIVGVSRDLVDQALEFAGISQVGTAVEASLISAVQSDPLKFSDIFTADELSRIQSLDLTLLGIDLTQIPQISEISLLWIMPIASCGMMILSQIITMKMSGSQMQGSMKMMPYIMSLMFLWFGFTMPAGVSFYWILSNVFGMLQSVILRKIYDPEKLKAEVALQIEEKRKSNKKKRKEKDVVIVKEDDGEVVEKKVTLAEKEKLQLQKAREEYMKKYEE